MKPALARAATVALLLAYLLSPLAHAAGDAAFQAGVDASRAKQYEQAIEHFLQARNEGHETPALYHNLGVAYFKTGQYDKAADAFSQAARSEKMAAISYYNLGLVDEARGEDEPAARWFHKARDEARTARLRRLAERKLGLREVAAVPYVAYLEAFAGTDSNPQLVDDTTNLNIEKESDNFFGALVYGRYHFGGNVGEGVYILGSAYSRRYQDVDEENTSAFSGGVGFRNRAGSWRSDYQLSANRLSLDGDEVTTSVIGSIYSRKSLASGKLLGVRLVGESLEGDDGNGYDYLSGERFRLRLRLRDSVATLPWKLSYEVLYNDRGRLESFDSTGALNNAFDASPLRHNFQADIDWPLTTRLTAEFRAAYRISDYRDEEVRGGADAGKREDDRWSAGAALAYAIGGGWLTRLEATYWDNDSNFDAFDYDRSEVTLSIALSI